jgi:protein ImuA
LVRVVNAGAPATLNRLRQAVAEIEGQETDLGVGARALAFGVSSLDAVPQGGLEGGLARASLHEIAPATSRDFGAAAGFTFVLAARAADEGRTTLWIQTDFAAAESGSIYGPGCDLFGLPSQQLLILKVRRPRDALWAMEEALKSRALASVIAELPNDGPAADLTATRRLTIAAREGGGFGFLFRHRSSPLTSSAETRWEVAAASSRPDQFGGLGRAAFDLSLIKNRRGPTGRWSVTWNHHERAFSTLSVGLAEAAVDRPARTPFRRAG